MRCAARKKILFVGVGGAASICDEAAHLFIKAGIDAVAYRDGYTQTIGAANLTRGDVHGRRLAYRHDRYGRGRAADRARQWRDDDRHHQRCVIAGRQGGAMSR